MTALNNRSAFCIDSYFLRSWFFFFSSRRRHTRCSRDWSSDVCSSDLSRGYRAHSRLIRSICSRAYTAGCGPESIVVTGTYAAQNWPPTAPARSFGMSVISCGWLTAKSTESSPPRWRIASGMSLWPSMRGTVRRMATARARFVALLAARRRNDGRTESVSSTSTSPHIPLPSFRPSVAFRMCAPWLQFGPESWRRPARLSRLRLGTMPDTKAKIALELNGEPVEVAFAPHKTLLEVLREDLGLTGTKHGCELGECGTCTVLVDGVPVLSCLVLGLACAGRRVKTVEGMAEGGKLHPLQHAFAELGAAQCGYCTPAFLLAAEALLAANPRPTRDDIKQALAGNLCRCTGYIKIYEAVEGAAAQLGGEDAQPAREVLYGHP